MNPLVAHPFAGWSLQAKAKADAYLDALNPDFARRDRAYWKALFKRVAADFARGAPNAVSPRRFVAELRRVRFVHRRQPRKEWEGRFTTSERVQVRACLDRAIAEVNDRCADAERAAFADDRAAMRAFRRARSCCGRHEEIVTIATARGPRKVWIGFNYGH